MKYIPENPSIESPKLHGFLETLETFRAYFGCRFPGTKFCNKFAVSYLKNHSKRQDIRIAVSSPNNCWVFPETAALIADQL